MDKNYLKLSEAFDRYYILQKIHSNLSWDTQVKMPKNGFYIREKQLTLINDEISNTICNKNIAELFATIKQENLPLKAQRNFALMQKIFLHQNAIPPKLKQEFALMALKTEFIWPQAKQANDFALFNKYFSKLIFLLREITQIKSEKMHISKYETLLDLYSPAIKEAELDIVFAKLAHKLPSLIAKISSKQNIAPNLAKLKAPKIAQTKLIKKITKKLRLNHSWCRIDESLHPFCTGFSGDVRITTKYDTTNFTSALMGIIHEAGHALYDNNLPKATSTQPIGQAAGMALHESQSLFFEMQIARSKPFCEFIINDVNKCLNIDLSVTELYTCLNFVEKQHIRIASDEVTYPLHIILRYQIEKDLINNKIETTDIPEIWSTKTEKLLQLKTPNHQLGCLQDIHWSDGSLGYFPSYSLGAIYASQISEKMKIYLPNFDELIATGKFQEIHKILKEEIHAKAHSKDAAEIMSNFTGKNLAVDDYLNYLEKKFLN